MRIAINVLLVALIGFLIYMLVNSIKEPIAFQGFKKQREAAVVERLTDVKTAQEIYREITGEFAGNFDSLNFVLRNDSIPFVNLIGDPDDPENMDKVQRIVTYTAAMDSINALGLNLDSLRYIPFGGGKTFSIEADTLTYQSSLVHVVQVGTRWETFMGEFADVSYQKYDSGYDPKKVLKFGDMTKPTLTGNWE